MRPFLFLLFSSALSLAACVPVATPTITFDPEDMRFSGEEALAIETDFVTLFPDRDSGQPNNLLAAEWLAARLEAAGFDCRIDAWEFVNFSRVIPLHNAVCTLAGASNREIVLTAHHDQAPTTTQGADNDGSGVAILTQLAEIFAAEGTPRYTLVFLFADAEEWGNAGTARFVETHPDPETILAAISLDNVGKRWYKALEMDARSRLRSGYGPAWLQLTAQEAARAGGAAWVPVMQPALFQALQQAAPIAFMDEGTFVAAGIPSFGFTGLCDPEFADECYNTWHDPRDTIDTQTALVLGQAGLATEGLVRQLFGTDDFPRQPGPYLYFEGSDSVLRGLPLTLIFLVPVALFLASAFLIDRRSLAEKARSWRSALPHYLSLFLPLTLSVVLLYAMVEVGLLQKFAYYFATTKDPAWTHPRWPATVIWFVALIGMILLGRRLAAAGSAVAPPHATTRSLAFLAIGLAAVFVALTNPFSLLFMLPLFFWLLIRGRRWPGYLLDLASFLLGGLMIYFLIYFFGFGILRIGLYILWYLMMMFAIPMIHPAAAVAIAAILAAGLSLVIPPPQGRVDAGKSQS